MVFTMLPFGNRVCSGCVFTKAYVYLMGVVEFVFKGPGENCSNIVSPANLALISRTASTFHTYSRAIQPEIFEIFFSGHEVLWKCLEYRTLARMSTDAEDDGDDDGVPTTQPPQPSPWSHPGQENISCKGSPSLRYIYIYIYIQWAPDR